MRRILKCSYNCNHNNSALLLRRIQLNSSSRVSINRFNVVQTSFSSQPLRNFSQSVSYQATEAASSSNEIEYIAPIDDIVMNYFKPEPIESKYRDLPLNLTRPKHRIILTLESLGAATTETLYKVVMQNYPDAFESKSQFKAELRELKEKRRVDAKPNPFGDLLKRKDAGYVYVLTAKQKKDLLNKRRELLNNTQQQQQSVTEQQAA